MEASGICKKILWSSLTKREITADRTQKKIESLRSLFTREKMTTDLTGSKEKMTSYGFEEDKIIVN